MIIVRRYGIMAEKEKINKISGRANTLMQNVQDSIDGIYTDIHGATPELGRINDYMRTRMHKAIDTITNYNVNSLGISNISSLYSRLNTLQGDKSTIGEILKVFENDSLMNNVVSMYSQNVYLKEADKEYELILKYMPSLHDALDTRKEAVLSADHFTKDAINIKSSSAELSDATTDSNITAMRDKYDIDNLLDRLYGETDKLGEAYIYCVPYKKAMNRLLKQAKGGDALKGSYSANAIGESFEIVTEAAVYSYDESSGQVIENSISSRVEGLTVEFNTSGVIADAIKEHYRMERVVNETAMMSINESERMKLDDNSITDMKDMKKGLYSLDPNAKDMRTQDGLITDKDENSLKIPGCVVKFLDRTMVKPLYIDDIETNNPMNTEQVTFTSTLGGLRPGTTARKIANNSDDNDNIIIKKIAKELSEKIDAKFINANQDLTKEIYAILKYNIKHNDSGRVTKMRVTFIPPEDIIHSFFNKDPRSNRGISSLARSLFPAKLYSCLYISNVIGILTRGNDKRVYYVKQNVDTNISAVLLNTINSIRKSNFGLRQIENMNNIMNITGRFNDYVIPESASGDAPVRFEIMPGQDIQHPTELMNQLEEMAINATDVPMEVIQARKQLDFATHYTMSSTRFLRTVYNIQAKFTKIASKLLTRIYDAEFDCQDTVTIELPPPMYLALTNSSQMFQSANEHVENVTPMYIDVENSDPVLVNKIKAKIKKFYMKSFLPDAMIERIVSQAKMEYEKEKATSAQPDQGQEMM